MIPYNIDKEDWKSFFEKGENLHVEFKSSFNKEVIETLVAFSNAKGGKVFIGVNDKGNIPSVDVCSVYGVVFPKFEEIFNGFKVTLFKEKVTTQEKIVDFLQNNVIHCLKKNLVSFVKRTYLQQ